MTNQRKAVTAHGEVPYETVECDSCGNEVAKDDAEKFVIGDHIHTDKWSHKGDELEFKNYRTGWACEYCKGDPAGFPSTRVGGWFLDLPFLIQYTALIIVGILLIIGLSVVGQVVVG